MSWTSASVLVHYGKTESLVLTTLFYRVRVEDRSQVKDNTGAWFLTIQNVIYRGISLKSNKEALSVLVRVFHKCQYGDTLMS